MSTYNVRRFAQPEMLQSLQPANLITLLTPYADYLHERGFCFPDEAPSPSSPIDYATLSRILLHPTEQMDVSLVDALFFIQEVANTHRMDTLYEHAHAQQLSIADNATIADVALSLWLHNPTLLKRLHANHVVHKPKAFQYFQAADGTTTVPTFTDKTLTQLSEAMDDWFVNHHRGRGCSIVAASAEEEQKLYLLIRHGMPFKREGALTSGKSGAVFYRPEFHDVIIVDAIQQELAIFNKSRAHKEQQMYLTLIGQHLFGEPDYFTCRQKYTLAPLRQYGEAALVCSDSPGIQSVKLVEIQLQLDNGIYHDEQVWRSQDLFASLTAREQPFPTFGKLVSASFAVQFSHSKRRRIVKITLPNKANFDRKEEATGIDAWLRQRGFIQAPIAPRLPPANRLQDVQRHDTVTTAIAVG